MRDLYKKLGVTPDAGETEIRSAAATAEPRMAGAASAILLNDRRRPVYDRNRRLLSSIGRLRSRLGLTLTPFWARGDFSDFADAPVARPATVAPKMEIDSLIITRAFATGRRRSRRFRLLRNREILLATAGGVLSLLLLAAVVYVIQATT
jgi:hypothetical protein